MSQSGVSYVAGAIRQVLRRLDQIERDVEKLKIKDLGQPGIQAEAPKGKTEWTGQSSK